MSRWGPVTALFILAGCTPDLRLDPMLALHGEPGISTTAELQLSNLLGRDVTVTDLQTRPASTPLWAGGEGPWVLEPGTSTWIEVTWRPAEVGSEQARLEVITDAGTLEAQLLLFARVGEDGDGDGYSVAMGDCDDEDPDSYPDAPEACDGIDNDCDGYGDELEGFDHDGDGFLSQSECAAIGGDDCDDFDVSSNPAAEEECDGTDSDCNGIVDDVFVLADLQQGVCEGAWKVCTDRLEEPDYADYSSDYEASEHSCDTIDNDCDGAVDDFDRDGDGTLDCDDDDGDGQSEADGDCDDGDTGLTLESCGARRLVVTTSTADASYALIDLNLGYSETFDMGGVLFGVVPVATEQAVFTDRYGAVALAELTSGTFIDGVYLTADTWGVAYDPETESVWAAEEDGWLTQLDLADFSQVDQVTLGATVVSVSLDPDDGTLWACGPDGQLWHHDPADGSTTTIEVEVDCYEAPIVDVTGGRVLVFGYTDNTLVVVDRDKEEVDDEVAMAHRVLRGTLTDEALFIVTGPDDTVVAYDPDSLDELWTLTLEEGDSPVAAWWDEVRGQLWVTLNGADAVVRIDPDAQRVDATIEVERPLLAAADRR